MREGLGTFTVLAVLFAALSAAPALADDNGDDEDHAFKAHLRGYQEAPSISTAASGEFRATLSQDGTTLTYQLSYSGLEGDVRQAHIHFAQRGVNGGIVVFLCQTAAFNPDPTGLAPECPQSGTVTGALTVANMNTLANNAALQGIAVGDFAEFVQALRSGVTYANVHSSKFGSGEIRGQIK